MCSFVRATYSGIEVGFRGPRQPLPPGARVAQDADALTAALRGLADQAWVDRNARVLRALARPALMSGDLPFEAGCPSASWDVDGLNVVVYRYSPFL